MLNNAYCSDKYQYTMGKSFLETGRKDTMAVFNLFYRKYGRFTERLGDRIGFDRVGAWARRLSYWR